MAENKSLKDIEAQKEHDLRVDIANIKSDISKLSSDLADMSKYFKKRGTSYAKVTTDKVIGTISKELDKLGDDKDKVIGILRDELEKVQEEGKKTVESVEHKIQDNPFKSLLIAFLAGLFLGKISDRK